MILLDIIFYSCTKCEFGPDDDNLTAKCVTSLFVTSLLMDITELLSRLFFNISILEYIVTGDPQFKCFLIGIDSVLFFLICRHYNKNKNGVKRAETIMKKHGLDKMLIHLLIEILAIIGPVLLFTYIFHCVLK